MIRQHGQLARTAAARDAHAARLRRADVPADGRIAARRRPPQGRGRPGASAVPAAAQAAPIRQPPLDRARRRLPGDAHEHARRLGRQRRAARHPARPGHRPGRPDLGRQRLPDHVRELPPAGGPARRPGRPQARLPRRRDAVHAGLGAVRAGRGREAADRRALRPGAGRRGLLVGDHRHDRVRVPGARRARQGHERVHLRRRRRRLDRAARRRPRHAGHQLALDLLHQHPDRRCSRCCSAARCSTRARASDSTRASTCSARSPSRPR